MSATHPTKLDNRFGASEEFEAWPKQVGQHLLEPGSGVVVVRRRGRQPIEVSAVDARALAEAAPLTRLSEVLYECADEAERQAHELHAVLEEACP